MRRRSLRETCRRSCSTCGPGSCDDDHDHREERLHDVDVERRHPQGDRQQREVHEKRDDVDEREARELSEHRTPAPEHDVAIPEVGVEDGDRPGQHDDDQVVKVVAEQVLKERPGAVPEDRVPAPNREVEQLLPAPEVEPDGSAKHRMIAQAVEVALHPVRSPGRDRLHAGDPTPPFLGHHPRSLGAGSGDFIRARRAYVIPCSHGTHVRVPPAVVPKRLHSEPDATISISFGSIPSSVGEVDASPCRCEPDSRPGVEADSGAADM